MQWRGFFNILQGIAWFYIKSAFLDKWATHALTRFEHMKDFHKCWILEIKTYFGKVANIFFNSGKKFVGLWRHLIVLCGEHNVFLTRGGGGLEVPTGRGGDWRYLRLNNWWRERHWSSSCYPSCGSNRTSSWTLSWSWGAGRSTGWGSSHCSGSTVWICTPRSPPFCRHLDG